MTFEQSLARLNKIAEEMENPEIPLKKATELYSEADKLIEACRKSIEEAKLTLEKANEKGEEA